MILEPAGAGAPGDAPTTRSQEQQSERVTMDIVKIDRLRDEWQRSVAAHAKQVQEAANAHYQVINELRAEQNRLIDEAERVGRIIDLLEKQYQDLIVPRPQEETSLE